MAQPPDGDISRLLTAWSAREPGADERLFSAVYAELRKIAASQRRPKSGPQPADDCVGARGLPASERTARGDVEESRPFLRDCFSRDAPHPGGPCATAESRETGRCARASPLDDVLLAVAGQVDLVELDLALEKLEQLDPRGAKVVELRFFAGLTVPQVAAALGVSRATIEREWTAARAWLRRELNGGPNQWVIATSA